MKCPYTLITSITATAALLAEGRSSDEIALLGTIFTQLGDTLTTISVMTPQSQDANEGDNT